MNPQTDPLQTLFDRAAVDLPPHLREDLLGIPARQAQRPRWLGWIVPLAATLAATFFLGRLVSVSLLEWIQVARETDLFIPLAEISLRQLAWMLGSLAAVYLAGLVGLYRFQQRWDGVTLPTQTQRQ